ncbi:helix-turn-helix domain-containing protein [Vagococcus zengguangii]|uniref:Uncharacterized protein n=1 Tax=Vagococcus zengguangii TaxID=2571750 RepID=A0A4D7CZ54_9ENTE|nr:helix-turn-helix domain-containing protein [Vagococcus zengguangii]QCI86886.1 hypothetical protein FA707_07860 [Vagococcus zengguangii]TLG80492.1 hypothetical protein FE258_05485 [Vagococcus zengguangii]
MFIEKNISKKIELMYYLEAYGGEASTEDLLKFLDTTIVTLKKYIKEINTSTDSYEIVIKGSTIHLISDYRQNSIMVSKLLLGDSINLKLLLSIFFDQCNLTELSQQLYMTKPTVLYKINHINKYFEREALDIQIVYNDYYEITGHERIVRHFFRVLLLEMGDYEVLRENQIIFNEVHLFFKKNYRDYHTRHESLMIDTYLLIALNRVSKHYYLHDDLEQLDGEIKTEVMIIYNTLVQKKPFVNFIESTYNVIFSPYLIANIIPIEYIEEILFLKEGYMLNDDKEHKISDILKCYLRKYGLCIPLKKQERYIKFLTNQLVTIGPINQVILRDFDINYKKLAEINLEKSSFLYRVIASSELFLTDRESLKYEFCIFFLTIIDEVRKDYFGINQSENIRILLYYSENNIYSEIFESILKDKYENQYKITIDYINILYNDYQVKNYDVIISDIYLEDFEGKYLYYSRYPSNEFWQEFEQMVLIK